MALNVKKLFPLDHPPVTYPAPVLMAPKSSTNSRDMDTLKKQVDAHILEDEFEETKKKTKKKKELEKLDVL